VFLLRITGKKQITSWVKCTAMQGWSRMSDLCSHPEDGGSIHLRNDINKSLGFSHQQNNLFYSSAAICFGPFRPSSGNHNKGIHVLILLKSINVNPCVFLVTMLRQNVPVYIVNKMN
jgi:hypothetical protein